MLYSVIRLSDMEPAALPEGASVALGFFDGLHIGHCAVISEALSHSPSAVWTIRADGSFGKGRGLLTDDAEKLALLRDMGAEYAVLSDFESIKNLDGEEFFTDVILSLKIGRLSCGRDFSFGRGASSKTDKLLELCSSHGISLTVVDDVEYCGRRVSSTEIKSMIEDGNVAEARRLLRRPYSYSSAVIHGKMVGRKLGYPTANQIIPENAVFPKKGVYASAVTVDGRTYPGATNIGTCPTVTPYVSECISESHIMGYEDDIYGKTVKVGLLDRLRDEKKFSSVDELKEQIAADSKAAAEIFEKFMTERI